MVPYERADVLHVLSGRMPHRNFDVNGLEALEGVLQEQALHARPIESKQGAEEANLERKLLELRGVDVLEEGWHPRDARLQRDRTPQ